MNKRIILAVLTAVVSVVALTSLKIITASASLPASEVYQAEHGVLDIRDTGAKQSIVTLRGEWEFYWKQRLEPKDFLYKDLTAAYITVPSSWNGFSSNESDNSSYGFGTYRLLVHLPASDLGKNKALFLRAIGSAYRLWIDGEEMPGLGTVGSSLEEEQPKSHMNLVFFQPKKQTVELIIQVSNYSFREGGINREIVYGDTVALIPGILKELLYDIFVIGGFLMIGIYHLIVFGMRKKEFSALFVGLVSLDVSMRTLFINGYLSSVLLYIESWELLTKLEYMSELFGFITLVWLMKSLYPREIHAVMMKLALIILAGLFLFVLLTPARTYTESMLVQSLLKTAVLLYFVMYVGFQAYLRKREGALIHLTALVLIVYAIINDTLYYLRMADTVELLSYSIIPFIMAQAIIVSHRHALLSRRNDALLEELGAVNTSLEQKVAERTKSLQEANERRTKMLANIAHDLGTPLIGIQTYLQLMVMGKLSAGSNKMTGQLLDKTDYVKRLVDDLFELSKLESRSAEFKYEIVDVRSWIDELHDKFEADITGAGMSLIKKTSGIGAKSYVVRIDKIRMRQVLQNFLDNAVKFSKGMSRAINLRGIVRRDQSGSGYELVVEVEDYGKGLTEAELAQVFNRFYLNRENNESGSGLGLAIVQEIVEQHQGNVGARSERGAGSTFYFILPVSCGEYT